MDQSKPSEKALHRKRVLELAKKIGISAACVQEGMDRTSFYKWLDRFDEFGMAGLEDRPPVRGTAKTDITKTDKATIIKFARENPSWGCERIASEIGKKSGMSDGLRVGKSTVHQILAAVELSTRTERWLDLEERLRQSAARTYRIEVPSKFLWAMNPNYHNRDRRIKEPGRLLYIDCASIGPINGFDRLVVHLAIDASSGYAFARIDPGITAAAVAKLLTANVLPFFEKYDISLRAVSISNRKISAEAKRDHLRAVLNDHQVKQLLWNDDRRVSGFGERFLRAAKAEFVKSSLACKSHQSLEELRESFRVWRQAYNKQELQGYPNFGRSPSALITPKK